MLNSLKLIDIHHKKKYGNTLLLDIFQPNKFFENTSNDHVLRFEVHRVFLVRKSKRFIHMISLGNFKEFLWKEIIKIFMFSKQKAMEECKKRFKH